MTIGDGRSTEALVAAGDYGYAHSAIVSANFPVRAAASPIVRDLVLLQADAPVTAAAALAAAHAHGLVAPGYEDALHFGIAHPDAQRAGAIVFLHEPWEGHFGRRDVVTLWSNAGRRELGLDGFDDVWPAGVRFAFVQPPARP